MHAITAIFIAPASARQSRAERRTDAPALGINAPAVEPGDTPLGSKPGAIGESRK
jgi:hypothetical protein